MPLSIISVWKCRARWEVRVAAPPLPFLRAFRYTNHKAVETYFIGCRKSFKDRMVANNHEIHWTPEHIKYGRFGKWIEKSCRDWISRRNRYWEPRFQFGKLRMEKSMWSEASKLEELTGKKVDDLHRHFVDDALKKIRQSVPQNYWSVWLLVWCRLNALCAKPLSIWERSYLKLISLLRLYAEGLVNTRLVSMY